MGHQVERSRSRIGMLVTWGPYSVLEKGESVLQDEGLSAAEYRKAAARWKAERYDPVHWIRFAKRIGVRYMYLTARHCDGFCLFDSDVSNFNSMRIGPHRDLVKEFVDACRANGMRVGLYYSLADMRSRPYREGPARHPARWRDYVSVCHAQLRELLSRYGTIDFLWYDAGWPYNGVRTEDAIYEPGWPYKARDWKIEKLNRMAEKLQPGISIFNSYFIEEPARITKGRCTNGEFYEQCMTLNLSWGYHKGDRHWARPKDLLYKMHRFFISRGDRPNWAFNIGPRADGTIPELARRCLNEIGKWVNKHSGAVHGDIQGDYEVFYIHDWRAGERTFEVSKSNRRVKRAYTYPDRTPLKVSTSRSKGLVTVRGLPRKAPDKYYSVIVLEY